MQIRNIVIIIHNFTNKKERFYNNIAEILANRK